MTERTKQTKTSHCEPSSPKPKKIKPIRTEDQPRFVKDDKQFIDDLLKRGKIKDVKYVESKIEYCPSQDILILQRTCGCRIHPRRTELKRKNRQLSKSCTNCRHNIAKWSDFVYKNPHLKEWHTNEINLRIKSNRRLTFTHTCGFVRTATMNTLLNNPKCPQCKPTVKSSNYLNFQDYITKNPEKAPNFDGWTCDFKYAKRSKLTHLCGFSKYAPLYQFNGLCPFCDTMSFGEKAIANLLSGNRIKYIREFRFPNSKKRYDFAIPHLKTIIEYDGLQHYSNITLWNISVENSQQNDAFKESLANEKDWTIFRIDYKQDSYIAIYKKLLEIFPKLKYKTAYTSSNPKFELAKEYLRTNKQLTELASTHNMTPYQLRTIIERHELLNYYKLKKIQRQKKQLKKASQYAHYHGAQKAAQAFRLSEYRIIQAHVRRYGNKPPRKHPPATKPKQQSITVNTKSLQKLANQQKLKHQAVQYAQENTIILTAKKFGISESTVARWFKQIIGQSYTEWCIKNRPYQTLKSQSKQAAIKREQKNNARQLKILEYYKTHTTAKTVQKFNMASNSTLNYYCRKHWGMNKKEWVQKQGFKHRRAPHPQMYEIAKYRKTHKREETAKHFDISANSVDYWFKEVVGMTKTKWSKLQTKN